ncbi:hypothetical protein C0993_011559 [Termitomyces sp. T159_Od127]|nr:hypothetical protein C0993_011559 [Termitomyces sp. T159_Od127]
MSTRPPPAPAPAPSSSTTAAANANAAASAPSKPTKSKPKPKEKPSASSHTRLKTVVRRLPPNLPADVFWGSVAPWAAHERVAWRTFCPGRVARRAGKESVLSRAYIAFRSEAELVEFGRAFDGHVFRDKSGNEYQAVVEYAPYQKVPSEKKKVDARSNTIEKDEDYLSFIASLRASETAEPPSLEALSFPAAHADAPQVAAAQPQPAPKTTPLLEALKAEKSAHKDKEAILRSHAHYKDNPTILAAPARGGASEAKKKGGKAPAPAQTPAPESGKKGKKPAQPQGKGPQPQQPAGKPGPGKAPRPPKPAKGPKQPAVASAPAPAPAPAVTIAAGSAPAPVARRTRPVIGGSRHFEAALSGAVRREQPPGQPQPQPPGPPSPQRGRRGRGRGIK